MSQPIYILTSDIPSPAPQTSQTPPKPTGERDGTQYTGASFDAEPPQPISSPPNAAPTQPEPIAIGKKTLQRVPVDAKFLKAQMSGMIAILEEIFAEAETKQGMRLQEVELSVEINGAGEVSLLGTGASLENTGAITLTFTRSTP